MGFRAFEVLALLQAVGLVAASTNEVNTAYFPLNYKYGQGRKVATDLVLPGSDTAVEVCLDSGSEMFWVFGPETQYLWGARVPPGPCSMPVGQPFYDYKHSPEQPIPQPMAEPFFIGYGGGARLVVGNTTVTESLAFSSAAGEESLVPNITVAIASQHFYALPTAGNCSHKEMADVGYIDRGILGVSKYIQSPEHNSTVPHIRHDLLERGVISNRVQSMWFDQAPGCVQETFTGGALFGGIDTSKFTGPLVKMPTLHEEDSPVGYYIKPPRVAVNGLAINQTGFGLSTCHLDSGTVNDALPITSDTERMLMRTAGLVKSTNEFISWNGTCESVPSSTTIDLTFTGSYAQSVTIKVPLRNYVRQDDGTEADENGNVLCRLNLFTSESYGRCVFGAPFHTAAFFAADDDEDIVALAQGGVSPRGSGTEIATIVATIP